jgi:6-pyruvoyltetrahydropterin/6-carboxytetrahydropterin synthase
MNPRGTFSVAVTKEDLVFAAAHFITLPGHRCERLHGHNYRAGVTVSGELDSESWYVVDFVALKGLMKRLTDELDHRVLLATQNPKLTITRAGDRVTVRFDGAERYAFPADDCALLPIANTTAELLAQHLAQRVRDALALGGGGGAARLHTLELEVEENFGQSASYREVFD